MKKIAMVEYQGRCDENKKAVGHAPKVLEEYYALIRDNAEVTVFAPKVILKELPKEISAKSKVLPKHIVMKGHNSFWEKVTNKLHMFTNIRSAIRHGDAEVLWFFNVEYYIMLYLAFCTKPKQKIVCTMFLDGYHNGFVGKVKQWVFEKAQKKIDCIISTGIKFEFKNCRYEYIPDYYYREEYENYQMAEKEEIAVCLGTMGQGKELEEMTKAFSRIGYPLIIAGRFYDKERCENLQSLAGENITIKDTYLSEEEYLQLLGKAKYTVLPYSPRQYSTQTSGVLQEAIFLETIPITYEGVLEGNGTPGIGFLSWDKLTEDMLLKDIKDIRNCLRTLKETKYRKSKVANAYHSLFEGL